MLELLFKEEMQCRIWTGAAVAVLLPVFAKCFYNLYLHPLKDFPGPKLAAVGGLYEFWFDVVKDGQYLWEIERMHEKYGTDTLNQSVHVLRVHD